jgi:hypothetical protein
MNRRKPEVGDLYIYDTNHGNERVTIVILDIRDCRVHLLTATQYRVTLCTANAEAFGEAFGSSCPHPDVQCQVVETTVTYCRPDE